MFAQTSLFPAWAQEIRSRYLGGEASVFVLYGNVHDLVVVDRENNTSLISAPEFLSNEVLKKKSTVIRYNVSTGSRFLRPSGRTPTNKSTRPSDALPWLEQLLRTEHNVAVLLDYAEMIAPNGDVSFLSEQDRLAIVTIQRWSLAADLENSDNIVILTTDTISQLHPKVIGNPRVAAVNVPVPGFEDRERAIRVVNPDLDAEWTQRFANVTAGLKIVQVSAILRPAPLPEENAASRLSFIRSLIGDSPRAHKVAAITRGLPRDEIREIIGAEVPSDNLESDEVRESQRILQKIGHHKREIIERECSGLIEFVTATHDFSFVGGLAAIKSELMRVAKNFHAGHTSRVPLGMLFTGPMGTGKTFVAEAFVNESKLTGIKLKNFRSKWVGSTESNLEKILEVVKAIGNVVLIIDEGDRSFSGGTENDGGTNSRVIARLKEFMSDTANRGRVLFIVMTNRPDKLDIDIKRAGRLDRKIPFLYPQTAEHVESILGAQFRKHSLVTSVEFPKDRELSERLIGYSSADIEAVVLAAHNFTASNAEDENSKTAALDATHLEKALRDYLPSRDIEMLEYMELLAVFESSSRNLLPPKYAAIANDKLQKKLTELAVRVGNRR